MIHSQNFKHVVGLAPISLNSAAGTALTCDTQGFSYALVIVTFGVIGGAATAFKINESASDFSGSDITAYLGGASGGGGSDTVGNRRLPQTTDAGKNFVWGIPLGGARLRYLQFQITTGATTLVAVNWILSRAGQIPNTNTERGVTAAYYG